MNSKLENPKTFFIRTLGCKVNQYESQAMRESLLKSGFAESGAKDVADIYVVNTCTVTEHADKESRYAVSAFHRMNPSARIVVTGCYVENDADEVSALSGVVDVVRNIDKGNIAQILSGSGQTYYAPRNTKYDIRTTNDGITDFKDHTKAFIKIQDGCENRCAYCKVPLVRPVLKSKPIDLITEEAAILAGKGFKEIVLAGICLGAWGRDIFRGVSSYGGLGNANLIDVLKAICKIGGDFRIRLSSIEPLYVTDELLKFIAANKKICRHLHVPLQSGDDEILKRMNRPYSTGFYRKLAARMRAVIKDVALTTDVLVGFPGERDENFKNTVNFIKEITPARTHIFTFSKRKGTAAYDMQDEIAPDISKKRYNILNAAALAASYIYRDSFLGRRLDVLVESKRHKYSGLLVGYSDNYIRVAFEGTDDIMRHIVPVTITGANLTGTMGVYGK